MKQILWQRFASINQLSLVSLFFSFLITACDEPLPRPSKKGKDTFGCKINAKNFVPNGGGFLSGMKPLRGGYSEGDNKLNIYAFGREEG